MYKSSLLDAAFSDHLPTLLCINSSVSRPQPTLITQHYFKQFSKARRFYCCSMVYNGHLWWSRWQERDAQPILFLDILNQHAPVRMVIVKKNPSSWITKAIRKEMDRWNSSSGFIPTTPPTLPRTSTRLNKIVWFGSSTRPSWTISIICCSRSCTHRPSGKHSSWLPLPHCVQSTGLLLLPIIPPSPTFLTTTLLPLAPTLWLLLCQQLLHLLSLLLPHSLTTFLPYPLSHSNYSWIVWANSLSSIKLKCATGLDHIPLTRLIVIHHQLLHHLSFFTVS